MKNVDIVISKDGGEVTMDGKGFEGKACQDFIGGVLKNLGQIVETKNKPEFYVGPKQKVGR